MLGLYANVRPARSIQGLETRYEDVDLVIVRENTEDLYAGIEHMVGRDAAESIKIITREASERIARYAFDYAVANGRRTVTAVHKANIMKLSDGLFLESCRTVAAEYDGRIEFEDRIVDNMCMQLVQKPDLYDVLVLPNLYGDIVSDLAAGLVGGLGVAPGANIGTDAAVFEPVHGSAPKYAGQNKANPTALILSGALMLRHLGRPGRGGSASRPRLAAVDRRGPARTYDLGGPAGTSQFADAIIDRLTAGTDAAASSPRLTARSGRPATHRRFDAGSLSRKGGDARVGIPPHLRAWRSGPFVILHVVDIFLVGGSPSAYDDAPVRSTPAARHRSWSGCSARRSCITRSTACGSSSWTSGRAMTRYHRRLWYLNWVALRPRRAPGHLGHLRPVRAVDGLVAAMSLALRSRSGRVRPQGDGFETAVWYLMRLTGLGAVRARPDPLPASCTSCTTRPSRPRAWIAEFRWSSTSGASSTGSMLMLVLFHAFLGMRVDHRRPTPAAAPARRSCATACTRWRHPVRHRDDVVMTLPNVVPAG